MAPHRLRIDRGDARIRLHAEPLFVAAHDAELLDDEGVGTGLVQDGAADRRVESLDERDDRNNRRDGDDIAEHRHQRPEFGRPDGAQRDGSRVEVLVHGRGSELMTRIVMGSTTTFGPPSPSDPPSRVAGS